HDVYVGDQGYHRVEKFTPSGEFVLMFGKGVNQTTGGDICTAASGNVCEPGASSSAPDGFQTPTTIAVDSSSGPSAGDVYVGDAANGFVSKFSSSGSLITSWGSGGRLSFTVGSMGGVAVGPTGDLFVLNWEFMHKYDPDGNLLAEFRETNNAGY